MTDTLEIKTIGGKFCNLPECVNAERFLYGTVPHWRRRVMPAIVRLQTVTIRTPTGSFDVIDVVTIERRDSEGDHLDYAESKLPATDHPRDHVRWLDERILRRQPTCLLVTSGAQDTCPDCGGDLGGLYLGRLERHAAGCPRFPL